MIIRPLGAAALLSLAIMAAPGAYAQRPGAIGPAVNTSPDAPTSLPAAARAAPTPTTPATPAAPAADAPPATDANRTPAVSTAAGGGSDRIQLGTTEISGNRELPKLMYIVPWQRPAVGKITGRPPNSLVDEALMPVDRTVFQRQNDYYAALQAASAQAASRPASQPASQPALSAPAPGPAARRDEK